MDKILQDAYDSFSKQIAQTAGAVTEEAETYINGRLVKMTLKSEDVKSKINDGDIVLVYYMNPETGVVGDVSWLGQISIQSGMFIGKTEITTHRVHFHQGSVVSVYQRNRLRLWYSGNTTTVSANGGAVLVIKKVEDIRSRLDYYEILFQLKE